MILVASGIAARFSGVDHDTIPGLFKVVYLNMQEFH